MNLIVEIAHTIKVAFKAGFQMSYGTYRLWRLKKPIIAVFGGKRAYETGKYAEWAKQVGKACVEHNMSVITGGGPGVMMAANCGAAEVAGENKKNWTLGIGVKGVDITFDNPCAPIINVQYFFIRKWLLTHYSSGFILFPGGIGTMDEFFEVLNLTKLGIMKQVPVVLVGSDYWKYLVSWFEHAFEQELIPMAPKAVFVVTDDPLEAVRIIADSLQPKK